MTLTDRRVLVTGGGGSIGRHLVQRLVESGCRVAALDRDENALDVLQEQVPTCLTFPCDVTDPESIRSAYAAVAETGLAVDVLVNSAGLIHSAPLLTLAEGELTLHSAEAWNTVLAANLTSVFHASRLVVADMVRARRKGVVVNVSSISAAGNAGQSAYSAAKAGVDALTRAWAQELAVWGLRFVSIAPGFIDTPSTRDALSESALRKLQQRIPLRKLGQAENVFEALRFAVVNDYVNGTVIEVDGGLVL